MTFGKMKTVQPSISLWSLNQQKQSACKLRLFVLWHFSILHFQQVLHASVAFLIFDVFVMRVFDRWGYSCAMTTVTWQQPCSRQRAKNQRLYGSSTKYTSTWAHWQHDHLSPHSSSHTFNLFCSMSFCSLSLKKECVHFEWASGSACTAHGGEVVDNEY